MHSRRQPIFIAEQMLELQTPPWSIMLERAIIRALIPMKQDDDDTDGRLAMGMVKTLESPYCHPISKRTIWTTSRRSNIDTRRTVIRQYELHGFNYLRNGAVPIQSLHALHLHICDILLGPYHHHYSNANSQPSTYYASLILYPPRRSHFPMLVETRMFLNQRPEEITTFPNTRRLLVR